MLSRRVLSSPSAFASISARRHLASVAAPAINGQKRTVDNAAPTRFVPENAQGRFVIEQV
jgi:hypothetical protein